MSGEEFAVWQASDADDERAWLDHWTAWPARETYAHPAYVALYADEKTRAACAAWKSDEGCVLYPFLIRDVTAEHFCPRSIVRASDLTSPQGYVGPFFWGGADAHRVADRFWAAFSRWAAGEAVVSEFVRLALFPELLLPYPGGEQTVPNVVRALDLEPDVLWSDFAHKVRKNVKKAQRADVEIEFDRTGERLDDFLRVYEHTMGRRGARREYYFSRTFFQALHEAVPDGFVYAHAVQERRVLSTELIIVSADNVYSFLGGTDADAFDVRPNDLLKYEVIRWAREEGKRRYVLGGGYRPSDGVFRFKLGFAPGGQIPCRLGRRVFDERLYATLVEARAAFERSSGRAWQPPTGYFPAYRG